MPRTKHPKTLPKRFILSFFLTLSLLAFSFTTRAPWNQPAPPETRHGAGSSGTPVRTNVPPNSTARPPEQASAIRETDQAARARASEAYGNLPVSFEANRGQFDEQVRYFARANGMSLFLTPTEAVLAFGKSAAASRRGEMPPALHGDEGAQPAKSERAVLRMRLVGANAEPEIAGVEEQPGKSNYFIGNDPERWHTNVTHYARVQYRNVYQGVDLVYYGNGRQLEYDLVVAPGASPESIKIAFDGARGMKVDEDGSLRLRLDGGELSQPKPFIYQESGGERTEVAGRYVIDGAREVGFEVAAYDASLPLVIDPVLSYSTYLGGNRGDAGFDIAVDSLGNAYVTGSTESDNFPSVNSLPRGPGSNHTFVTKLNAAGSALVYSTYLGTGSSPNDSANSIAVDGDGNAYITGWTASTLLPTVNAYQSTRRGGSDAFVMKLSPSGSALVYSTYLGGSVGGSGIGGGDEGRGISVDAAGSAYVVGRTETTDFPTLGAAQTQHGGGTCDNAQCNDAFVTKFHPSGASLVYSTYLGGDKIEYGHGIALDSSGSAYVTGFTASRNFPTTVGALQPAYSHTQINSIEQDGFVTKLNPAGTAFVYSTYLGGGHGSDSGHAVVVDSAGNAYVTGQTNAGNFPTVNAFQPAIGPGGPGTGASFSDAFVSKLNPTGSALLYSTFLGGTNSEEASAIGVDAGGHAYVVGYTNSPNFPVANAVQPKPGSPVDFYLSGDAFITKVNPAGSSLAYSTFLGGSGGEWARGVAVHSSGSAYVTGHTTSNNFPTLNPYQATQNGGLSHGDAFVTKIVNTAAPVGLSLSAVQPARGGNTSLVTITLHGLAFAEGASVKLVAPGRPDISAIMVGVNDSGTVAHARFDLKGQPPGQRDVVIVNPDNKSSTRAGAFTIEVGGAPQIWVDILGRDAFRPSQPQTFYIAYGNRGNVDAALVPIFIAMPKNVEYKLGFKMKPPRQPIAGKTLDFSQIPLHYETGTQKVIPLLIGFVPAGHSNLLKITITSHDTHPIRLSVGASEPKVFSEDSAPPPSYSTANETCRVRTGAGPSASRQSLDDLRSVNACVLRVIGEVGQTVLGIAPGAECLEATLRYLGVGTTEVIDWALDHYMEEQPREFEPILPMMQETFGGLGVLANCADRELPVLSHIAAGIGVYLSLQTIAEDTDCGRTWKLLSNIDKDIKALTSRDPNDKFGPNGVGAARHTSGSEPLRYAVFFENKADANAPAQEIVITDQLDPSRLDFDTFSLGLIGFGKDQVVVPPSGLSEFGVDVDLRTQNNLVVRVHAKLDKSTGLLTWRFTSLDPATGLPTEEPLDGFLPPNLTAPEGEGQVLFTVRPKEGVATGTEIRNKARIVFDTNAPIDTPEWLNTIDNSKPSSRVQALAAQQDSSRFEVSWSGEDTGSGVHSYTVYASENGGTFYEWRRDTTAHSAFFTGQPGRSYAFYSVARDAVGNYEAVPAEADASTATRPLVLQLSASGYAVGEGDGRVIITVVRSGNLDEASVGYATGNGTASDRSDYTAALGTLRFAAGETAKSFNVLVTDDALVEGVETLNVTLSGPAGGATLGGQSAATISITDNDTTPSPVNPIGGSQFFVRQHYHDFLNRAPDPSGLAFWTDNIEQCGADAGCREVKRINVSAAFFLSIEFQETGYLAYRAYKAAYGDATSPNVEGTVPVIRLNEFLSDSQRIGQGVQVNVGDWERQLEANKNAYTLELVSRQRFADAYPAAMTTEQFVDKLDQNAGGVLSQVERDELIAELAVAPNVTQWRAKVLRKVAEDADLRQRETNRAFVLMQFYGYLRRNPDDPQDTDFRGWKFWLDKLNQFDGDFVQAEMVKAFLDSDEYRKRFGQ